MTTGSFIRRSGIILCALTCMLALAALTARTTQAQAQPQAPAQGQATPPAPAPAAAQQQTTWKQLPPDPKYKTWGTVKTAEELKVVQNMLRGTASFDEKTFDSFFNNVVFPQFTLVENIQFPRTVNKVKNIVCLLPSMRKEFKDLYGRELGSRQARDRLNQLALKAMTQIAADNGYHPIARYNAMLLIADLNEDEAAATPYKQALGIMKLAARSPSVLDAVRVAALIGIVRHAKAGIDDPASRADLAGILTQLVNDTKRPAGRAPEGHDWMRRRALEALAAMYAKEPPADGSFLQLLSGLLQEKDSTMELRAEAAKALLTVKIVVPPKFDAAKMAAGIGQIAVDAYRRELETTDQFGRKISSDGMKYYFTLVDKALAALNAAAPTPKVAELKASLDDLVEKSTPEETTDLAPANPFSHEKLYDNVADSGAKLEAVVTGRPVSEILPKRSPVGGNTQSGGFTGRGGYGATSRDSGPRAVGPPPGRSGYGGVRGGYGAGR